MDLVELFRERVAVLPVPAGSEIAAVSIPEFPHHRVGKDANERPCLLLQQAATGTTLMPIRLANLTVDFGAECNVVFESGQRTREAFTVVRCVSDTNLWPLFMGMCSQLVERVAVNATSDDTRRAVLGLVDLFQSLTLPPAKTVQGLWAELMMIDGASDAMMMAAAWHRDPNGRFDFAHANHRLEVKSTSRRRREHHFSLEQLQPAATTEGLVVSIYAETAGGGVSIADLLDRLRGRLRNHPSLWAEVSATAYRSLGSNWNEALGDSFDWNLARESIAFYPIASVPRPASIPNSVSEVRFASDLSAIPPHDVEDLRHLGGLLAAAVPRA